MSIYTSGYLSGNALRGKGQNLAVKNMWGASQKQDIPDILSTAML